MDLNPYQSPASPVTQPSAWTWGDGAFFLIVLGAGIGLAMQEPPPLDGTWLFLLGPLALATFLVAAARVYLGE